MRKRRTNGESMPPEDGLAPMKCDIGAEISEAMKNPEYRKAHEGNREEFALRDAMLEAQRRENAL